MGMLESHRHTRHGQARGQHLRHKSRLLWSDHESECTRLEIHEQGKMVVLNWHTLVLFIEAQLWVDRTEAFQ